MRPLLKGISFGLVILMLTAWWMMTHRDISESELFLSLTVCWITISAGIIIISLVILSTILNQWLPWSKYSRIRFFLHIILGTIFSIAALNVSYYCIKEFYTAAPPDLNQLIVANTYSCAVIIPMFSIYFGYQFLKNWRKSELEAERLLKENARSQMMALKNHLDPHFLFNNLNILSSIMDKDTELSKRYLDKFAEVYRIILRTETADLTTVDEEMHLVHAYAYMVSVRFENSIKFEIEISPLDGDKAIPPLAIQMLIENAIKHNMASETQPVIIKIYSDNKNNIIVSNNLQIKKYATQERPGSGLQNIKNRYKFFTDKEMLIVETVDNFTIKLPLLNIEYD